MSPLRISTVSFGVVGALGLFGGCMGADEIEPEQYIGVQQDAIQGGYVDDQTKAVVGLVRMDQGQFGSCSGTLIAPNVVLTAQHCIAPTSTGGGVQCSQSTFGNAYSPNSLYVTTKTQFTQNPSNYYRVREVIIPPGEGGFCGYDQAILVLDSPIPSSDTLPMTPRVDEPLVVGEEYYAVGFGATGDGQGSQSGVRRRRDNLFIKCVSENCPSYAVANTEWVGDTGVCQGDSGGPAIDLQNRVIGVASRGSAGCENPVYGYVHGWGQWIIDVTLYATSSSGLDAPPWATGWPTDPHYSHPVGDACTDASQCASNACLDGYCTRLCDKAPCPDGFVCAEAGYCQRIDEPAAPTSPGATEDDDDGEQTVSSCSVAETGAPNGSAPWWLGAALAGIALRRRKHHRHGRG